MIERKKKLRLVQLTLLIFGILIIYTTYYNKNSNLDKKIISKKTEEKVKKQTTDKKLEKGDVFFNVKYSGLDLNGNRYILNSEEAYLDDLKPEIVYMKIVHATFYFKNNTVLNIWSDNGTYNNKNLDMKFEKNVKAKYLESDLTAEKAEYSNSKSYLTIYENVRVDDVRGNLVADKLLFDIVEKKLDITSFNEGKISANVELDEKRF
ncbi:LPS export ABC transporter periplasmic protein LptC [Pelagibacteraceae bacterium]|jgi:hypothetical protein|nr:LPS export ABC transporter periplasmic protein LptC [Pelagibacteraceae bacterium]|tara:strand:+ start:1746 stop:2366 length:621 start_codon:yes stop_codon:yes gene_type:complete